MADYSTELYPPALKAVEARSSQRKFFPEIESLRAIAVTMTMLAHFIPMKSPYYVSYLWFGVDLFFTISGFLITYILLINIYGGKQESRGKIIKNFFIRRVLRLFPVYYAFILFFFVLRNVFSVWIWKNDYNFYFFTYLQNMYYFKQGEFNSIFSHLWSLGVEEQFYMIWPFLMVFLPARWYMRIFILMISCSLFLNFMYQESVGAFRVLTVANLHTLGAGALLAYMYYFGLDNRVLRFVKKYSQLFFVIALTGLVVFINIDLSNPDIRVLFMEIFLMFTTFFAVMNSVLGWPSILDVIFKNRHIHHVGKVSYGIYLFHMLVPTMLGLLIAKVPALGFIMPSTLWLRVILLMMYSYGIAVVSYYTYEIYFLKLKSRFI